MEFCQSEKVETLTLYVTGNRTRTETGLNGSNVYDAEMFTLVQDREPGPIVSYCASHIPVSVPVPCSVNKAFLTN